MNWFAPGLNPMLLADELAVGFSGGCCRSCWLHCSKASLLYKHWQG
jgi:hypothetical protein